MPIGTTAALLLAGGSALSAAGSVAGGAMQKGAANDAASASLQGQREALAFQKEQAARQEELFKQYTDQARADLAPLRDAQLGAVSQLQGFADASNPIYQAERDQSTQAIQRQLASQGLLRSKKQSDLLSNLELGLTQQRQSVLGGLAGLGAVESTANLSSGLGSALAGVSGNLSNQVGSGLQQLGQTLAQNNMAQGQINAGMFQGVTGALGQGLGSFGNMLQNQQQMAFLQKLLGK
jgi:hypothetical protein